ncbi:LLM class flavin-dependent oxidoreductase [Alkalicoccobacillus porphyridii]|uniref:LLM class flavin-dependent oxidoreductase n=1 Tax=Alkalicoccobacillus porphyridii TaxID=2597270 RepID=UPI00163D6D02|nr:LLM class flavin-dependent oxidoreductase [Alkalicoccobacillus porphyridii]
MIKLGILDQIPLSKGHLVEDRLKETLEMVQLAEQLGYSRYWFAEHHGTKGMLSSAPEILMAAAAASTKYIRIGTGGILLPQYSPYKVAEVSKQLAALFPGRIDIGIGRSPGGNRAIQTALSDGEPKGMEDFDRKLRDLVYFIRDQLPNTHAYSGVKAVPQVESPPPIWLLGLGENSAELAADHDIGFVFGHFIKPQRGAKAFEVFHQAASPNTNNQDMAAIFIICADTDEEAWELAKTQDLWLLKVEKGIDSRVPSPEEVVNYPYTALDKERMIHNHSRMIIGSKETVRRKLMILAEQYGINEFLILCNLHYANDRKKSYQLVAEAVGQS